MAEDISQFEGRKRDHIDLALQDENEARGEAGFELFGLEHEALPDLNYSEIDISTKSLGLHLATPFFVSSMTAGHAASPGLNMRLAKACLRRGWMMGVGSQRREIFDAEARHEWLKLRESVPEVKLLGNLGIAQLIETPISKVKELVESLSATAMIIHLNALQECMQPEGTTNFKGSFKALADLADKLSVPVIVKETGCGFSKGTLFRLNETKIAAVDVSGYGGTHWGRIEGRRAALNSVKSHMRESFKHWGISTVDSLLNAQSLKHGAEVTSKYQLKYEIWASGGIRSGLDAAKAIVLGAQLIGFAKPILAAALKDDESLNFYMESVESELKTALFCTGSRNLEELRGKKLLRQVRI